jgi:hypothetical protein
MWPRKIEHPLWCAGQHHCTAEHGGEHSSEPQTWRTVGGRVVATRHQPLTGKPYMVARLVIELPAEDDQARRRGGHLITAALNAAGAVFGQRPA